MRFCLVCNNDISNKRKEHKFCSRECSTKYRSIKKEESLIIKKCLECSKEFTISNVNKILKDRIFCSRECSSKNKIGKSHEKIILEKKCLYCETSFLLNANKQSKERKYCSLDCAVKGRNEDPVYKIKLKESHNTIKAKENHSKAFKTRWENTESRDLLIKSTWGNDEWRNKKIDDLNNRWTSEEFRNIVSAAHDKRNSDPEFKEYWSKLQKEVQGRQTVKDLKSIKAKEKWNDPEYAEKCISRGYAYKKYVLPSGTEVKLQGYEPIVLDELLKTYHEDDIVIGVKNINNAIGPVEYQYNNSIHRYFPDFFIKSINTIIEVKSKWTYEVWKDKNDAKKEACIKKGYNFKFEII